MPRRTPATGDLLTPVPVPDAGTVAAAMRIKLQSPTSHAGSAQRKTIVDPALGQSKATCGFRHFSGRRRLTVAAEWLLIRLTHNLLKLFRAGGTPQAAWTGPRGSPGGRALRLSGDWIAPPCPIGR